MTLCCISEFALRLQNYSGILNYTNLTNGMMVFHFYGLDKFVGPNLCCFCKKSNLYLDYVPFVVRFCG